MPGRFLHALDRPVSVLGFGTWPLGGPSTLGGQPTGVGRTDPVEARRALERAFDLGIDFFDTADIYGNGIAETLLGETLGRTNAIFCTKFGNREIVGKAIKDFSPAWTTKSIEASLRRLRRDRIDILLMHGPPDDLDWAAFDATPLERAVESGRIGTWGVSCRGVSGAENLLRSRAVRVIEVIYNAFDRRVETKVLPEAQRQQIDVIARVPLASGFLTERATAGPRSFASDDIRTTLPSDDVEWRLSAARRLARLSAFAGGLRTGALRFAISDCRVATVIPGMRSVAQVEANFEAVTAGPLGAYDCQAIRDAVPEVFHGWR